MISPEKHTLESIWGHGHVKSYVPRMLSIGRLPHALLLSGPSSIGKRSLALAFAKIILNAGAPYDSRAVSASAPPRMQKSADGEDLFGEDDEGEVEDTLTPDMFGEESPEPDIDNTLSSRTDEPDAVSAPFPQVTEPEVDQLDPGESYRRICRLVESSYPPEYDKDFNQTNIGHFDLTIIEPAGNRRGIVVDQIRNLQKIASVSPIEGHYRVVLIFGADTITAEGGNSILKILEEPPSYLVMILVADRLTSVLPTIRSRCSVLPMSPLPEDLLIEKLREEENLERSLAEIAATLSEGAPGVALQILEQKLLDKRREVFEARLQIDRFGEAAVPGSAARINKQGGLEESLWLLTSFARDRLVYHFAKDHEQLLVHKDQKELLRTSSVDPRDLDFEVDRLLEGYEYLAHPFLPNTRSAIQLLLLPE